MDSSSVEIWISFWLKIQFIPLLFSQRSFAFLPFSKCRTFSLPPQFINVGEKKSKAELSMKINDNWIWLISCWFPFWPLSVIKKNGLYWTKGGDSCCLMSPVWWRIRHTHENMNDKWDIKSSDNLIYQPRSVYHQGRCCFLCIFLVLYPIYLNLSVTFCCCCNDLWFC